MEVDIFKFMCVYKIVNWVDLILFRIKSEFVVVDLNDLVLSKFIKWLYWIVRDSMFLGVGIVVF